MKHTSKKATKRTIAVILASLVLSTSMLLTGCGEPGSTTPETQQETTAKVEKETNTSSQTAEKNNDSGLTSDTSKTNDKANGKWYVAQTTLSPTLQFGFFTQNYRALYKTTTRQYGFFESFPAGIKYGWNVLAGYVSDLKYVFSADGAKSLGGFGAIGNLFPATWDWHAFWLMTAFLSIILAFMNILPIPALDGGHVLFLLYEMITGRKPSENFLIRAEYIGFGILILLMVVANLNDILRWLGYM